MSFILYSFTSTSLQIDNYTKVLSLKLRSFNHATLVELYK